MRIATAILGLVLSAAMFVQSALVNSLSRVSDNKATEEAGGGGVVAAFLMLLGGAFAYGLPRVAMVVFALSGLMALAGVSEYPDLGVWAGVAFVLAVMSFFGWRGKRRADRKAVIDRDAQVERAVAAGVAAATSTTTHPPIRGSYVSCASCDATMGAGSRYCPECGAPVGASAVAAP